MCLKKNLEKQLASLERAQKEISNDIKNCQIEDRMLKICLPKFKTKLLTLKAEKAIKKTSKLKTSCTTGTRLELAFWRYLVFGKQSLYAWDMRKNVKVGPNRGWWGDMNADAMLKWHWCQHMMSPNLIENDCRGKKLLEKKTPVRKKNLACRNKPENQGPLSD